MPSTVLSMLSSTDIYSDEKFIGTSPKEVLYLDVGIANFQKIWIHMRIENATVP